ncbi:MAG: hypothetical protein ACRC33_25350 [Gemmataceae bacterium]
MPASITVVCPECDKEMKAPAEAEGKKIRCKGCGQTFVALVEIDEVEEAPAKKKPAAKPPEPKKPEAKKPEPKKPGADDEDANPYGMTFEDLSARCPECANQMESEDAVICLYCGFNTYTRERSRTRKVKDISGFDVFWWLLPGIASAIATISMIAWIIIHWGPLQSWMGLDPEKDKESWAFLAVALYTKLWTTIPLLFLIYSAGRFAISRLIFNNRPPEVEEKFKK